MRKISIALTVLFLVTAAVAHERGTPAEAKAMLEKAVAHYDKVGEKKALADFNTDRKQWISHDLYVFCVDKKGMTLANGGFPERVGGPVPNMKTNDGVEFGKALWDAVDKNGSGEVRYSWTNPTTKVAEQKVSYVKKAGTNVCGVGAYVKP